MFTYNKAWQKHLEKKLGLKPTMNNGFGGKEYEVDKKRIRPPRAPVRLSIEARAKLANRLRQSRNFSLSFSLSATKPNCSNTPCNIFPSWLLLKDIFLPPPSKLIVIRNHLLKVRF